MRVIEKYEQTNLNNNDVKWYLFDEQLWVTKCKDYMEVDASIAEPVGSFNLLYESNDTILFDKVEGFETAIIYLSGIINNDILKEYSNVIMTGKKGNLLFAENNNVDFNFLSFIIYDENDDTLLAFPTDFNNQKDIVLHIVDDFGFVIRNHELSGWFLKKASEHVCISQEHNKEITPQILARYLKALKLWEDNEDITELEKLLAESMTKVNEFNCALRECITNLL